MRRVVLALLSVVILGILGMHVLSQHCAPTAQAEHGTHSTPSEHAGHAADPVAAAAASAASAVVAVSTGDAGGSAQLGMLLCAFIVLASAIALLLVGLRGHTVLPSYDVRRARSLVPRLRASPSGTGPPPVWQFSVIRC
ncbi:hypothetical protein NPS01_12170 [Nocardioides psychrotolerans]|uniref:Uncharacterized protein n=1 Tax=Nocardioides psychrotolerans TaxID=1005945 RepID=A0A1I3E141_9ACTN|nr:DUF6153 family protein [Nocardioides psychrotolerans]GEP37554.1 hypothetical protein NPS01_12170 [Nocardioides psychrotolerans]SFH92712.1 hypothetical protein SAMN05216561_103174 [Nocardioides psychrotolerans]